MLEHSLRFCKFYENARAFFFLWIQAMFARFPNYFGGLVTDKLEEKMGYERTAPCFNGIGSEASATALLDLEESPSSGSAFCIWRF